MPQSSGGFRDNCHSFDRWRKSAQAVKRTTTVSVVTIGKTGATQALENSGARKPLDPL
jgi:hypothetical protein